MPQRLPRDIFVGTGLHLLRRAQLDQDPALFSRSASSRLENLTTSFALFLFAIVSTWLWSSSLVRRVSGERFYDLVYALLLLLGGKLVFDGARWLVGAGSS